MAGKQVITVGLDGSLLGLDHKRKGLDLRQFGNTKTQRATLIEWHESFQKWFIVWTANVRLKAKTWDSSLFIKHSVRWGEFNGVTMLDSADTVFFDDYEDAVAAEVAVIQAMQFVDTDNLFPV